MPLTSGVRLGPYEIIAGLGAGGMGEVYRARDTKLGRDVAIKIVSDGFGHDPERLARFQREAHLLASLNHPHIAAIYGLEEANGSQFLVLELVEGETLAERLKSGPLPVPEALTAARQIADALQAAHEKGIIHRDLKPANIAFTSDGQVKVLDFGLAKELETAPSDLANSPTMTLGATQAGVILGTAAYMAPEQAKGRAADKRSDVWAFGCVLYEMLTGKRAFDGPGVTEVLTAVLRDDPDSSRYPGKVPPTIRVLVERCLRKDRAERIADISVVHFLLTEPALGAAINFSTANVQPVSFWRRFGTHVGVAVAAATFAGSVMWSLRPDTPPPSVSRLQISPPTAAGLTVNSTNRHIAITPDGSRIVYTGNGALLVRALDQLEATALTGLGLPNTPFLSPDGQWIGFVDGNTLKKVTITGGPAIRVTDIDGDPRGVTWASDGSIFFGTANDTTGLQRVSADGGDTTVLTRPDRTRGEGDHFLPYVLPRGEAVLFTITAASGGLDQAQIAVLDLRTGTQTVLIRGGSDARYVAGGNDGTGYLVYAAAGTARVVGFDLERLVTVGTPVPMVPQVLTMINGAADFAMASNGTLVYVPGGTATLHRLPVWVDRLGRETPIPVPPRLYDQPRLSHDGTRLALHAQSDGDDIWLWDFSRAAMSRFTFDAENDLYPVWSPDSARVYYSLQRGTTRSTYVRASDGTGSVIRLTDTPNVQSPTSISPDGTWLVFTEANPKTSTDVMRLRLDSSNRIEPLVQSPSAERNGEVSPDGRWLAYEANDSGTFEIYVRPLSDVNAGRWQISTGGGRQPLWSRNGEELFYLAASGGLMRTAIERRTTWVATAPAKLLDGGYYGGGNAVVARSYDVAPDGRFVMIKSATAAESALPPSSIVVVQHFDEELRRLVPIK